MRKDVDLRTIDYCFSWDSLIHLRKFASSFTHKNVIPWYDCFSWRYCSSRKECQSLVFVKNMTWTIQLKDVKPARTNQSSHALCSITSIFRPVPCTIEVNQVFKIRATCIESAHNFQFSAENTLLRIRAHAHFRNHESRTTSSLIDMFRGIIFSSKIGRTSEKRTMRMKNPFFISA